METSEEWHDLGEVATLKTKPLSQLEVAGKKIALIYKNNEFSAISGVCNHVGGPLGDGVLDGDYVVCPWRAV